MQGTKNSLMPCASSIYVLCAVVLHDVRDQPGGRLAMYFSGRTFFPMVVINSRGSSLETLVIRARLSYWENP